MEHQTRYDLDAALEAWRAELAAQPNLTAEVRRELETHLRDTLAGFQQRGLSDEEAFWLARRRVGQLPQVGEEFVKADPLAIWRERVYWMAATLLVYSLWSLVANNIHFLLYNHIRSWAALHFRNYQDVWSGWTGTLVNALLSTTVRVIPLALVAVYLLKGRLHRTTPLMTFFSSRKNILALTAITLILNVLVMFGLETGTGKFIGAPAQISFGVFLASMLPTILWFLSLAGFTAWLMPPQNKNTPKTA